MVTGNGTWAHHVTSEERFHSIIIEHPSSMSSYCMFGEQLWNTGQNEESSLSKVILHQHKNCMPHTANLKKQKHYIKSTILFRHGPCCPLFSSNISIYLGKGSTEIMTLFQRDNCVSSRRRYLHICASVPPVYQFLWQLFRKVAT